MGKTIAELYPDGYSIEWRKHEMKHYIEKCKEHEERTASAWKLLDKANLTEKERRIVSLRFGLDGSNEWRTLAEVARHMSCSREYCRQVVQRSLRKLRKAGIQNGLVDTCS